MKSKTTTDTPEAITAIKKFKSEVSTLIRAGVGVILVRATEATRARFALEELCPDQLLGVPNFAHWSCRDGWTRHIVGADASKAKPDNLVDPIAALKAVMDIAGEGKNKMEDTLAVMVWPDFSFTAPLVHDILRQYSFDLPRSTPRLVLVVPDGTTLPPRLQRDVPTVDFRLPGHEELAEVMEDIITGQLEQGMAHPFTVDEQARILSLAAGMTEAEFSMALACAITRSGSTWPDSVSFASFAKVISETKTEVVKRSEVLELVEPGSPDDVGGLDLLKAWVDARRAAFTPEAREFGVDAPKGLLMIGPPGTGKSASAKAIAGTLGLPLLRFDIGKVFGSLVGQSEERIRSAVKQLEAMAPCVAWVDEIDSAGMNDSAGKGDSGTSSRVMGTLLTALQENTAGIFWVLTGNRAHNINPALLRKGRMDEVFAVMPPNKTERMQIIEIHLRKRKQSAGAIKDLSLAVAASKGFVGAEIEAAVKDAVLAAFNNKQPVTGKLIAEQFGNMKPISVAFKEDFDAMAEWASNNARPTSSPDEESSEAEAVKARLGDAPRTVRRIRRD